MQNRGTYKCGSCREACNVGAWCIGCRTCKVPGKIGNSRRIPGDRSARCRAHIQALERPSRCVRVRSGTRGESIDREKARVCSDKHTHPCIYRVSENSACDTLCVRGEAHSKIE